MTFHFSFTCLSNVSILIFQFTPYLNRTILTSHSLKIKSKNSYITSYASPQTDAATKSETPIELRYPAFPTVMDINQIREILPHQFAFLLVDRVIEYNPGVSVVAIKNVTINDINFFPGHFPERPITPDVLMVEKRIKEMQNYRRLITKEQKAQKNSSRDHQSGLLDGLINFPMTPTRISLS